MTSLAHPLGFGTATVVLRDGRVMAELVLDSPPEFRQGEASREQARDRRRALEREVGEGFTLSFDGKPITTQVRVIMLGEGPTAADIVEVVGKLPSEVRTLRVILSDQIGTVSLVVHPRLRATPRREVIANGKASSLIDLLALDSASETEKGGDAPSSVAALKSGAAVTEDSKPSAIGAPVAAKQTGFLDFVVIGFEHILPLGLDHILFVLGVFLLSTGYKKLVLQLSLFTIAHSVTLALGTLDLVRVSPRLVEPLIALSIAYVGIERKFPTLERFRATVIVLFGLLHGLGFAGVLLDLGFYGSGLLTMLLGFNLGVELGQIAVVALALAGTLPVRRLRYFREQNSYERGLVPALSYMLVAVGLFWFVERLVA